MGCHIDGMKRANNNIRDWLDEGGGRLSKGEYGVDGWVHDADTVAKVRELYPPSSVMRAKMEEDRRVFLNAAAIDEAFRMSALYTQSSGTGQSGLLGSFHRGFCLQALKVPADGCDCKNASA
jgi:hypothetical protein